MRVLAGRRWEGSAAAPQVDAKIEAIVDQISKLTLLETADLVAALKVSMGIVWAGYRWRVGGGGDEGER